MKFRARQADRECALGTEDLLRMWDEQKGLCALSGIQMTHTYDPNQSERFITNASVDRIDSDGGYTSDNVQLVCTRINLMKGPLLQKTFYDLCRIVVNFEAFLL
jgi:hypothetical protein